MHGTENPTQRWWLHPSLAQFVLRTSARAGTLSGQSPWLVLDGADEPLRNLDDPAQRELGDYELCELIGRGGMGVVYRAHQRELDREVALKLLSPGRQASETFIDLFRREAQNAALLQHPNIVVIHEMGEHDGLVYYAMQLVRGRSLSQRLAGEGPLGAREAAGLLRTIAEAVDYAHRLGVLHLDLKPGNVLLDAHDVPHVADFGLARRLEQALDAGSGLAAGTPSYMAPEQAANDAALTPAADVWALGAMLYELLTGQPPFDGGDARRTLRMVRKDAVRPPSKLRTVPADLDAICLKCLQKAPADRYPGARALADDLGRYLEGRTVSVRPLNAAQRLRQWTRREPKLAIATFAAVAALLAGIAATGLEWRRAEGNAAAASERLWESRRNAALREEQDGNGWDALPLLLHNVDEQERAGNTAAAALDRKRMGMLLGQGASLIDTIAIADANPLAVALSDDGSRLAISTNDLSVRWYDTASLTERGRISLRGRVSSDGAPRSVTLLRFVDNNHLLATMEWYSNMVSPNNSNSWLLDLASGSVVEPPAAFRNFSDASFSADGQRAILRDRDWRVQLWQVAPWTSLSPLLPQHSAHVRPEPWLLDRHGKRAWVLAPGMSRLDLFDAPRLRHRQAHGFSRQAHISAWQASHDGRLLALGDFEGRILLLDVASGVRHVLSSRGREITWLAFSEDDRWLAGSSIDGAVRAFNTQTRESLVSSVMQHDFPLRRVGISRAQRLLVAAGEGRVGLWRLPDDTGPRAIAATRIGTGPAAHAQAGPYAIDWSLQSGLLASAGIDGQVRLWRLPPAPALTAVTPPQVADNLQFDGRRLVDVEWNRLRLIRPDGVSATPWMAFPQPPGFAELTADGSTLLVTIGPSLQVRDAASLALRVPPIPLPDSPQRLLSSPDGKRVLLGFGAKHASGFADRLLQFDTTSGQQLPGEAVLAGPLVKLAFSADGRNLLAIGPADAATTVLDGDDLRLVNEYAHDPFQPIIDAVFSSNQRDILMLARAQDPRLGADALLVWEPRTAQVRARHPTGRARPLGLVATRHGAFVAGEMLNLIYDARGETSRAGGSGAGDTGNWPRLEDGAHLPTDALRIAPSVGESASGVLAVSQDQRFVAQASGQSVRVLAADDGVPIGAPLRLNSHAMDAIIQLSFSPDGKALLARTLGRWARWHIAPEQGPIAQLDARLARLHVDAGNLQRLYVPSEQERRALRSGDPGAWRVPEARNLPRIAGHGWLDRSPIPARTTNDASLLDMTAHYRVGPGSVRDNYYNIRPHLRPYPAGVQRFGGIEFDVRGMRDVGGEENLQLECVAVADPGQVAAVHALLLPAFDTPAAHERLMGELIFHYRDGGRATAPIRATREVPGYDDNDQDVPFVYGPKFARLTPGARGEVLAAPRLANPQPGRAVRCVGMRATAEPMLLLALTVTPRGRTPLFQPLTIRQKHPATQPTLVRSHHEDPNPECVNAPVVVCRAVGATDRIGLWRGRLQHGPWTALPGLPCPASSNGADLQQPGNGAAGDQGGVSRPGAGRPHA